MSIPAHSMSNTNVNISQKSSSSFHSLGGGVSRRNVPEIVRHIRDARQKFLSSQLPDAIDNANLANSHPTSVNGATFTPKTGFEPQGLTEVLGSTFIDIDFTSFSGEDAAALRSLKFEDSVFMGCTLPDDMAVSIGKQAGNSVFPSMPQSLFNTYPSELYTAASLYFNVDTGKPFDPAHDDFEDLYDSQVYNSFAAAPKSLDVRVSIARTLHDHSISLLMTKFLAQYDPTKVVAVMGGHASNRSNDPSSAYYKVVLLSKALTEQGYLMVSGGGPGAMEAVHVGAWFAGRTEEEVKDALYMLATGGPIEPMEGEEDFRAGWMGAAMAVMEKYPLRTKGDGVSPQYVSLGIPTYKYGHEPANPFATHIAKFFENAIREDVILAVAQGGVVFTKGSAGTMQEIFQTACMVHYAPAPAPTVPMVFLDQSFWNDEVGLYPVLQRWVDGGVDAQGKTVKPRYSHIALSIFDTYKEVVTAITNINGDETSAVVMHHHEDDSEDHAHEDVAAFEKI